MGSSDQSRKGEWEGEGEGGSTCDFSPFQDFAKVDEESPFDSRKMDMPTMQDQRGWGHGSGAGDNWGPIVVQNDSYAVGGGVTGEGVTADVLVPGRLRGGRAGGGGEGAAVWVRERVEEVAALVEEMLLR